MHLETGRYDLDDGAKLKLRYTAFDPMGRYVKCGCGKSDFWTNQLRPLREHMNALIQTILSFGHEGLIDGGQNPWLGTVYSLRMAVSIDDVFVELYIDESASDLYCGPAWEFDKEQRENSSKYVAALSIFNFVWTSYDQQLKVLLGQKKRKMIIQCRRENSFTLRMSGAGMRCWRSRDRTRSQDRFAVEFLICRAT